jgi:MAPEG family
VNFRRQQLIGVSGAVPGFLTVLLTWHYASSWFAFATLPADNNVDRLVFVLHWLLIPGLTLLAGVWIAGRRGFIPDAIDGTRTPASRSFEINLRYNQNTLEQVVLAAIAWLNLGIALPQERLVLIPAIATLFGVGRIAFWLGYLLNPMGRAFGMVLTILPTIAAYLWLVAH